MKLEMAQVIDRSVAEVFRFIATDHVRNHPQWDPKMKLEQLTDGPMGVGTVIRRSHTHTGAPTEGTMEVVEFEPDRSIGFIIRDGQVEMHSRVTFAAEGPDRTRVAALLDIPSMSEPMDPGPIEQSLRRMKELIESTD
jgi:uncharacterized protein YndB with AHSA1/START domain